MGVREAARVLKEEGHPVSYSTLSRQLSARKYNNYGTDARPLLDLDEVIAVRLNEMDPQKQRAAQLARGIPARGDDLEADAPVTRGGAMGKAQLRKAEAQASQAELDLMERERSLVAVEDVHDAGFEVGQYLRQAHLSRIPELASALVGVPDVVTATRILTEADHKAEDEFVKIVRKALDELGAR
ncbi:hypothetical protein [Nitrospirillum iridis]|uniref:Uncharacterized protein n=1 Tax=Nitrospirillum iridis TaxID=765888 RepID=A0A7X0AWI4_9PROT|nr:hypothetical protein [Nitrospirillum iridis]MBB6251418.1 hypothetical protein [Nitrospirillum iridis]